MNRPEDFAVKPELVKPLCEAVGRRGEVGKPRASQAAPKFIKFEEFSWEKFFRAYKLTKETGPRSKKQWKERIELYQGNPECYWALRFLGLIHFFEKEKKETNGVAASRIVREVLGLCDYRQFSSHRDKLKTGLDGLGIQLRVDWNKNNQYIRTVLFYSGWMYVHHARKIAKAIRNSSWNKITEHDFLCELLKDDFARFQTDDVQSEERLTLEDIVTFFQSLARLYLRYNAPFSIADIQELAPLKPSVATNIIKEMCASDDGEVVSLKDLETLPQIGLDTEGNAVFSLPKEGHFADGTNTVVFQFLDKVDPAAVPFAFAVYHRNDEDEKHTLSWDKIQNVNGIPLVGNRVVRSILRFEPGSVDPITEEQKKRVDVIPQVCVDTERTHLLLRLRDSKTTECGYELDSLEADTGIASTKQKLSGGARYKVVPLNGASLAPYALCGGEKVPLDERHGASHGCFRIPADADTVVIASDVYEVKTAADTYLNMDERVRNFGNPGRLFFERSCYPFTDACLQNGDITAVYVYKKDGRDQKVVIPFDEGGDWELPESVLWQSGTLILSQGDDSLFKRAVTFVDDLTLNAFDKPLDIEEAKKLKIRIGDEDVPVDVPKRVRRVEIAHRGFKFSIPVRRTGVYFEFAKQVIPIPLERAGVGRVHDLARKDFENLKCRISTSSEFDIVQVARGNTNIVRVDERNFVGNKLLMNEALQGTDSDYFALCVTHDEYTGRRTNSFYKFHLYDPQCKNVAADGEHPHSVIWRRDPETDDLIVTYWIPFCDQNRQKHIAFFPAHRQDQPPVAFVAETRDKYIHEIDENTGRCKETIRIPHFFKEQIDWGRGLICFIVFKQMYFGERHGYEVLTSGFFLKAPADKVTEITDDPFGLRAAFAGDENGHEDIETILKIMTSDDPATQKYVKGFLARLKNSAAELKAYPYLNSYWNKITREDDEDHLSGYAFMAGSYFSKIFEDDVSSEPYAGLWSRHLVGYQYLEPPSLIPMAQLKPYIPNAHYLDQIPKILKLPFWKMVKKVNGHVDARGPFLFKRVWRFSYPQLAESVRLARMDGIALDDLVKKISGHPAGDPVGIISELYAAWENVDRGEIGVEAITTTTGEVYRHVFEKLPLLHGVRLSGVRLSEYAHKVFRPLFQKFKNCPYIFYGGYEIDQTMFGKDWDIQWCLSDNDIDRFVNELGSKLHRWRKNPMLKDAQELRRIFVEVERIDALVDMIPDRPPTHFRLMDAVESVAWGLRAAEKISN